MPSAEGFRAVIASVETAKGDELSSSDFDTAFLQAAKWKDKKLVLIKYWDAFQDCWVYEWISGVIYGMQEGTADWKSTLSYTLTTKLGFKEVKNMESVYHHPVRNITIPCHVDDPLIKSRGKENRIWFHEQINELFDTKGCRLLTVEEALDYLSITIRLHASGAITLDNSI